MLELLRVCKQYRRGPQVLRDISFTIGTGEILSVLGPSGCGKTTLLNLILGVLEPTSGSILVDGEDVTAVPMRQRGVSVVFQDFALFPNLNAMENIAYGLRNHKGASTQEEVDELIELLDLKPHLNKRISELSGGQKQRVAIARTLVLKPRLLLMDEPLSALDGMIKESIKELIRQIARKYKLTIVIVTHDPEEALSLSDHILILHDSRIAQFGTPQEILGSPADSFVEQFICRQLYIKRDNIMRLFGGIAQKGGAGARADQGLAQTEGPGDGDKEGAA
ncbi:MAG: ABC transporter ATP-binding protein [Succinivibrio sp.]